MCTSDWMINLIPWNLHKYSDNLTSKKYNVDGNSTFSAKNIKFLVKICGLLKLSIKF